MDLRPYRISGFKFKNGFHPPNNHHVNSVELTKDKKLTLVCKPEFEGVILICVDRDRMRIRKGRIRLSPNEEAQLLKEETEKRRKLRLQQVREQSKENAAQIRKAVKQEKHRQLMKLANDIKNQLESEKAERVRHLEQQYDNSLRNIGVGHKQAIDQPDWSEEREMVREAENLRAEARGRSAREKLKRETDYKNQEANKVIVARQNALEVERERAKEVASMPPPPPDPLENINALNTRPVKVMDMNNFATTHYHMQNEHAVDRAEPEEEPNAREAAVQEQDRITERALELRRLRQDQLERARLRHNQALERELLKHDYNNILHDLSDLQRADRDRRLRVVHHIPKQVFEPPNFRMEDREDKQRQMEQHFEDMYMAGTDQLGDLSMALDPQPRPLTPTREDSLDVTGIADGQTPLREPSLPHVPPVLRDMTNMPCPKSPGKKPEKVLRSLMDRIKSQREEWMTSHSMLEVGEVTGQSAPPGQPQPIDISDVDMSQFVPLMPDMSPTPSQVVPIPAQVPPTTTQMAYAPIPAQGTQPTYVPPNASQPMYAPATAVQNSQAPPPSSQTAYALPTLPATVGGASMAPQPQPTLAQMDRRTAMPPFEFSEKLRATNEKQQTNLQMPQDQNELLQILKQQEMILEQKRQLELKLQQLTHDQQKIQLSKLASQAQQSLPAQQPPVTAPPTQPGLHPYTQPAPDAPSAQQQNPGVYIQSQSQYGSLPQQQVPAYTSIPGQPVQPSTSIAQHNAQASLVNGFPQSSVQQQQQQQFASSLSSSGMSQHPMNSIPPTNGTTTMPLATMVGQAPVTGYPPRSAYQPPSAVLTTDQLSVPAYSQPQMSAIPSNISMATSSDVSMTMGSQGQQDVQYPDSVSPSSLTADIHTEQMRKVKEYQQQLLAKHEQSKKVLEETKAEIKRRRENLLERYPKLDLSRLENLGAKYLENGEQAPTQPMYQQPPQVSQGQPAVQGQLIPQTQPVSQGQTQADQAANLTSLLATLANHPYYKATLGLPVATTSMPVQHPPPTSITVASVQQPAHSAIHPDVHMDSNLRKNKFENIRKSLPFDQDESFQTPIRVYEAYAKKNNLDVTSATDVTDGDTSTLTSKGSPALQPAVNGSRKEFREELDITETDMDTTVSGSFLSENDECLSRQEELRRQLADIQRQKEEIMKRTELGQQKLFKQESELMSKLSQISPAELGQQLTEGLRNRQQQQQLIQKDILTIPNGHHQQSNLSTILEVDTPISTRPSDSGPLSHTSSEGGSISLSARRLAEPARSEVIREEEEEEPRLECVETQMQQDAKKKAPLETVAEYSGKNISDVLERAKRFESEVLEKLRKQTNAVLFDNEFDDSLEFNVSRRQVTTDSLSTGSLSNSSMSTGPLDESQISSKPNDSDLRSANGSFRTTGQNSQNSWAAELSRYQMPASDQSDPSFKVLKPESNRSSMDKSATNGDTMFVDKAHRFKVYAAINEKGAPTTEELQQLTRDDVDAKDVIKLLREMQQEFRSGEEARQLLVQKLVEQQSMQSQLETSTSFDKSNLQQYSEDSKNHSVSRPFMSDQSKSEYSQYSLTDTSTDVSLSQSSPAPEKSRASPVQSGTSSREREVLVRRSPIGDNVRAVSPLPSMSHTAKSKEQPDASGTEYSFMLTNGGGTHRTTSTPGEDRQKSIMDVRSSTRSELPSEISLPEKSGSNRNSVRFQDSSVGSPSMSEFKPFSVDSIESKSPGDGLELTTSQDNTSKGDFKSLSLDSKQTTGELSSFSTAEESLQSIKKEFDRLKPKDKPVEKIKTYAVSRSGELISEHSDSDRSLKRDSNGLSQYSIDDSTADKSNTNLSQSTIKSSIQSESGESNVKSSSLTTVTSDQSLNATGASTFGQSFKEMSVSSSLNDSNGNNYVQDRFASLDSLISESKNLIQRHKQIIDRNKPRDPPSVPSQPPPPVQKSEEREITPKSSLSMSFPKPFQTSAKNETKSSTDTDFSQLTSVDTSDMSKQSVSLASYNQSASAEKSRDQSVSVNKSRDQSLIADDSRDQSKDQSSNMDVNSLDYLTEHSSGILEETLPDLNTIGGSELAFTKTGDLSDSGDSLKSFEKHELSEAEIDYLAASHSNFDDESLTDVTKSDTVQDIVEARKHNFMIQSERRAAAAKERALARTTHDEGQVFRAVPVNVVAMPTLSMSVSSGTAEKSSLPKPKSASTASKGSNSFADKKASFEAKEPEVKSASVVTSKPLNRALQPRGPESPQPKDSGMKPSFKAKGPGDRIQRSSSSSSTEEKASPMGKLAGEIRQFGGSTGLYQKATTPSPKKTPPKTLPKPVRGKAGPTASTGPSSSTSTSTSSSSAAASASGLSKTLSSWKKSRAVTSKPASASSTIEAPKNSIKVLPQDAPAPLTEEERRKKLEEEQYEKNIRAYNPRLFRLQHKLDASTDDTDSSQQGKPEKRETRKEP